MSRANDVLYDAPGPRTRRFSLIASVASIVLIGLGAWWFIYRPLKDSGQLSWDRWGLLLDPSHPQFGNVWNLLREGWIATFKAAFFAIVLSIGFGIGIALLRAQLRGLRGRRYSDRSAFSAALLRYATIGGTGVSRFWVELFRGLPVVVTIFFVFKVLAEYGVDFEDQMWFLVIGLTLYNSVVIGEIIRSGMSGLPTGQHEAAASMGLSTGQTIRLVLFPQALRIMLPGLDQPDRGHLQGHLARPDRRLQRRLAHEPQHHRGGGPGGSAHADDPDVLHHRSHVRACVLRPVEAGHLHAAATLAQRGTGRRTAGGG
jgi:glutamate transport system permease protein